MMVCTTINSIVRADGSPKYAMVSMLVGAILNIVLDPIFIFIFHLGVKGAAIATVISQIASFLLNVVYLRRLKSIELRKNFRFRLSISGRVSVLGISSFITQLFAALVMGLQNNLLKLYGAASVYGAEIPITVLGIVVKVNEILNSVILGMAMGALPIIGYNYGAHHYDRVKKTLKMVIVCGLIISSITFILFQTIPDKIILLIGGDDLFVKEAQIIKEIADQGACVIIGRCADYLLEGRENLVKIFVYSTMENKIDRAVTYYGVEADQAEKEIRKKDKERAVHYEYYTGRNWADKANYDIYMNSGFLGAEKTAEAICSMVQEKVSAVKREE